MPKKQKGRRLATGGPKGNDVSDERHPIATNAKNQIAAAEFDVRRARIIANIAIARLHKATSRLAELTGATS